jgi:prepilin-type N-terminal cleavage/methylation domain-containing protein
MTPHDHVATIRDRGFTLTELLVTITIIAALVSLTIPAWSAVTRARAGKNAGSLVMESLERARSEAVTTRRTVWVLFRHAADHTGDGIRILAKGNGSVVPEGPWLKLPAGITFHAGAGTLLEEAPPGEILSAAGGTPVTSDAKIGSVMFHQSGRIGYPPRGGSQLSLVLDSAGGSACGQITLSRSTGKPAIQ